MEDFGLVTQVYTYLVLVSVVDAVGMMIHVGDC